MKSENGLLELTVNKIVSGLKRKAITKCSHWAETYRVMGQPIPGPWTFKKHPWIREVHDCEAEMIIGQKGAQLAFTEAALNKVFYAIDMHGISVLYVLPSQRPDATVFSASRFDPALELSPHLQTLFSDVKNIEHKRAGGASLYIRGSRSRSQLKSIPVGLAILDEVDEMVQDNIPLVFERMSGHIQRQSYLLSTPTIEGHGINGYFNNSTQDYYFFKCPHCSKWTQLLFPECLKITADSLTDPKIRNTHLICKECQHVLEHETKEEWLSTGKWISSYTDRTIRGFHVSQLYSCVKHPYLLAQKYIEGLTNQADEQEFFNSCLGLPHTIEGAQITDKLIDSCIKSYSKMQVSPPNSFITMGIDVGRVCHYEVCEHVIHGGTRAVDVNILVTSRVLAEGSVKDFVDLDALMKNFSVAFAVIDANPEKRAALEFAQRFWGRVKLCYYGNGVNGKQIHIHDESEHTITVDRTSWMDLALGRFKTGKIELPKDISNEYRMHIKEPVRRYMKDANGNPVGRYITKENKADHLAHARTYNELALKLGACVMNNQTLSAGVL